MSDIPERILLLPDGLCADLAVRVSDDEIEYRRADLVDAEIERLRFYIGECTRLQEQLTTERQRARMPEELEMWARKLIAFDDGCDEAGEQNMTSIYEPLQLLRDILAWHEQQESSDE